MHFERKINGETIYDGKVVKLHLDDVMLEDGSAAKREYIEHSGGAAVVAEVEGGIVFVEQFRYAYGKTVLELPAGKCEKGENPMLAARRELEEETGYFAENLDFLGEIYPSPGYTDERIYLYRATGLIKKQAHLDNGEFLSLRIIKPEVAAHMVASGEIKDAKTLIGLLKYFCFFRAEKEVQKGADAADKK